MKNTLQLVSNRTLIILATIAIAACAMMAPIAHADTSTGNDGVGIFIGQSGNAFVHGATVTSTSTNGLVATTNLGGNVITWTVNASSTTRFGKLGMGLSALTNVAVGDIVSFFGKFSGSGAALSVDAQALRDKTFQSASSTMDKMGHEGKHLGAFFKLHGHGFFGFGFGVMAKMTK
jgi:hypothetical protein